MSRTRNRTPDQLLCQQIADAHYAVTCSENSDIAWYWSPVYRSTERAMLASIRQVYGLTPYMAKRVLEQMTAGDWQVDWAIDYLENGE